MQTKLTFMRHRFGLLFYVQDLAIGLINKVPGDGEELYSGVILENVDTIQSQFSGMMETEAQVIDWFQDKFKELYRAETQATAS
jgi:hypothetical protein